MRTPRYPILTLFSAVILTLMSATCGKNNTPSPLTFKLRLQGGNGQTDTIGRVLKNSLTFSAMQGIYAVRDGYLRYITLSCDNTLTYTDYHISNAPYMENIPPVSYNWQLNQTVGTQTLKVILLDSVKEAKDSLTVTANALAPSAGWHITGCLPVNPNCTGFAQLPSGRIFTALNQADYPYYSDDDGATWHHLTNFPVKGIVQSLVATSQNEIFITIPTIGIYYSADKGQTWQQRNNGLPLSSWYGDLQCTVSGSLFAAAYNATYYSPDKGITWQPDYIGVPPGSNSPAPSSYAASMTDGTIIATINGSMVRSRDGGASWTWGYPGYPTNSILIDSNNYIYIGAGAGYNMNGGIYLSKDTGSTYTPVYTGADIAGSDKTVSRLTYKNGFFYFYVSSNNILKQTHDFTTYNTISPPGPGNNGRVSYRYLVTNTNHFILSVEFQGLYYQTP